MTHPFHPLRGQEFELVDRRRTWGEDRVYYYDESGELKRLPAAWTSAAAPDPFVVAAQGRAVLRAEDLMPLRRIVGQLADEVRPDVRRGRRAGVSRK